MDAISYLLHIGAYWFILMIFSSPFLFIMRILLDLVEKQGVEIPRYVALAVGAPFLLWLFVCVPWLARNAAARRLKNHEAFDAALGGALSEGKIYLAFIPIIGNLLNRRAK